MPLSVPIRSLRRLAGALILLGAAGVVAAPADE